MHKSYSIPLPGTKLLPLTQITPHPCTRVKNSSVTEKDKNSTNTQTAHPRFSLQQPLHRARTEMPSHLPETALACKLPAAFDKSWSNGGWMSGLLRTASPSPSLLTVPPRPASSEDGASPWTRLLGKSRRALEHRGACACPGPSISSGRPAEEEELQGNIRAPHISPA